MEIIPAIMPKTYGQIEKEALLVRGLVSRVQVDIMDGEFVSSKSWPYLEGGEMFSNLVAHKEKLPLSGELKYQVDLMVVNSAVKVKNWLDAGFDGVIVHLGSIHDENNRPTNSSLLVYQDIIRLVKQEGKKIGIAIKTTTPNEEVYPFVDKIDFIQFMGIEKIGYQGQAFDERVLPKIRDLRQKYPDVIIQVDGGVSLETAPRLVEAGANRLVSGSAIWKSDDIAGTILQLKNLE